MKKEEVEKIEKILKPCPFCGSKGILAYGDERGRNDLKTFCMVSCGNPLCHIASGIFYPTEEQAIKAWNTRDLSQITIDEGEVLSIVDNYTMLTPQQLEEIAEALKKANPIKIEEVKK